MRLLVQFRDAGFAAPTIRRKVVLTRDLDVTTLADLINALDLDLDLDASTALAPWRATVDGLIQQVQSQSRAILTVKLRDILAGG
uniref:Uncharacterized protein n=1 Tax=Magnetospirillum gryphiswaldense TaxID=55518 RepID=A4TU66_9PROT|nr:hypothetical protein MGR_0281 [Magnetospirillum gryphiswaldense MSR-1]